MEFLKQNAAATVLVGPVLDAAGAIYTGAVIADFTLSKNGTAVAMAFPASVTHSHNGHFFLSMDAADANTLGRAVISCNKATYAMPPRGFMVVPPKTFDAIVTNDADAAGGLNDVQRIAGIVQSGRNLAAGVLITSGTGSGQLDVTNGVVKSNLVQILSEAIVGTGAWIAGAFSTLFNVNSPTFTTASVNQTGNSFTRIGAPVGASLAADLAAAKADTASIKTKVDTVLPNNAPGIANGLALVGSQMTLAINSITSAVVASGALNGKGDWYNGTPPTPPSVDAIAAKVLADLAAAHGNGSYETATGFAVPGSQMTLTPDQVTALVTVVMQAIEAAHGPGSYERNTEPPSDTEIATKVNQVLTTAHGGGSWVGGGGGGGTGDGARTVTISVNDGTWPVQSATVRVSKGLETYVTSANAAGVVSFNLDDGQWLVAITRPGYQFAGELIEIAADVTQSYTMTPVIFTPSNVGRTTGFLYAYDAAGNAVADRPVSFRMIHPPKGRGTWFDRASYSSVSQGSGLVECLNLVKGAEYEIQAGTAKAECVKIPEAAGDTYQLPNMVG